MKNDIHCFKSFVAWPIDEIRYELILDSLQTHMHQLQNISWETSSEDDTMEGMVYKDGGQITNEELDFIKQWFDCQNIHWHIISDAPNE